VEYQASIDSPITCRTCSNEIELIALTCEICNATLHHECEGLDPEELEDNLTGSTYICKACSATIQSTKNITEKPAKTSMDTNGSPALNKKSTTYDSCTSNSWRMQNTEPPGLHIILPPLKKTSPQIQGQNDKKLLMDANGSLAPTYVCGTMLNNKRLYVKLPPLKKAAPLMQTLNEENLRNNAASNSIQLPAKLQALPTQKHRNMLPDLPRCNLPSIVTTPEALSEYALEDMEKKLKNREKLLSRREANIKKMEQEHSEQAHQIAALKSLAVQLETKVKTIEEENRLLKIQILASTSIQADNTPKQTAHHLQAAPPQQHTCANETMMTTLNTHMLATISTLTGAVNNLANRVDNVHGNGHYPPAQTYNHNGQWAVPPYPPVRTYNHNAQWAVPPYPPPMQVRNQQCQWVHPSQMRSPYRSTNHTDQQPTQMREEQKQSVPPPSAPHAQVSNQWKPWY
jgi:hypothetical protein